MSAKAGLPSWGRLIDNIVSEATPWAVDPQQIPAEINRVEPVREAIATEPLAQIRKKVGADQFDAMCRRIAKIRNGPVDLQVLNHALHVVDEDSRSRAELQMLAGQMR